MLAKPLLQKQRIAVLVSGSGTNLQAILDAQKDNIIQDGQVVLVVSSKPDVYALSRAAKHNVPTHALPRKQYSTQAEYDRALILLLDHHQIDLVVLAGFLSILGKDFIQHFPDRILNVHPSLIPAFCGKGFYGLKVHQRVLDYGVKVTGATVHYVNEIPDGGRILLQKAVEVLAKDTPETLQQRVMQQAEWVLLPQAIQTVCRQLRNQTTSKTGG